MHGGGHPDGAGDLLEARHQDGRRVRTVVLVEILFRLP